MFDEHITRLLSILPLGGVAASYLYRAGRWHLQAEHNLFIVSTSLLAYLLVAVELEERIFGGAAGVLP